MRNGNRGKEMLFVEGAVKFQFGLESDHKKLADWLLENNFAKLSLIMELSFHGEHYTKIREFLQGEYCTVEVANSLLDLIESELDLHKQMNCSEKEDLLCTYQLLYAKGLITYYCWDKID